jgi:hypothetical protein
VFKDISEECTAFAPEVSVLLNLETHNCIDPEFTKGPLLDADGFAIAFRVHYQGFLQ